jgi:hypothetical protein
VTVSKLDDAAMLKQSALSFTKEKVLVRNSRKRDGEEQESMWDDVVSTHLGTNGYVAQLT